MEYYYHYVHVNNTITIILVQSWWNRSLKKQFAVLVFLTVHFNFHFFSTKCDDNEGSWSSTCTVLNTLFCHRELSFYCVLGALIYTYIFKRFWNTTFFRYASKMSTESLLAISTWSCTMQLMVYGFAKTTTHCVYIQLSSYWLLSDLSKHRLIGILICIQGHALHWF